MASSRYMRPQRPLGQGWDDPEPSDARASNGVYDPNTGPGSGTSAKKMGMMNRNGSFSPVTPMGSPTGPLTQPTRRMAGPSAISAESPSSLSKRRSEAALAYNLANPGLHQDEATGIVTVHPDAENRIAKAKASGSSGQAAESHSGQPPQPNGTPAPTAPTQPSGIMGSRQMPPTFSDAGQAASMRAAMAPNPGEDRYGRTSASPSAAGAPIAPRPMPANYSPPSGSTGWQQGAGTTTRMSGGYGSGSINDPTPASSVSRVASAVGSASGLMNKFSAGMKAATENARVGGSLTSKTPSTATFDGKSRDQFFGDAAARQNTSNLFAARPMPGSPPSSIASTSPSSTPGFTPQAPPRTPGFEADLKKWGDASEKIKAQDAAKAQQNAANQSTLAGPTGTVKAPSGLLASRPMPTNIPSAPTSPGTINSGNPSLAPTSPQPPAASTASAPAPAAAPQPAGPTPQEIQAQAEKAAASQRGYVGNAAKAVNDTAKSAGTAIINTTEKATTAVKDAAAAVPKLAGQMVDGAKKGFDQMGKDAFGTDAPTAETTKYGAMLDQQTAAKNSARGYDDTADLARYKAEEARRLEEERSKQQMAAN